MADLSLPYLPPQTTRQKRQLVQFGGVNYGEQPAAGELAESLNLSTRLWPSLSQREERGDATPVPEEGGAYAGITAAFAWAGKLVWVSGTNLYYNGQNVGTVEAGEKQFAVVNTKLCVWPDKKYIDLESNTLRELEESYQNAAGTTASYEDNTITFEEFHKVGTAEQQLSTYTYGVTDEYTRNYILTYSGITWEGNGEYGLSGKKQVKVYGADEINKETGRFALFMDNNSTGAENLEIQCESVYSDSPNTPPTWEDLTTDPDGYYAKFKGGAEEEIDNNPGEIVTTTFSVDIIDGKLGNEPVNATDFKVGDVVKITGNSRVSRDGAKIESIGLYSISFEGEDFGSHGTYSDIKIERLVPDMDFICESENRLWGCGGKTIYASALGDPTNFNDFSGVSTDSYSVAVGTDGDFTGCVAYSGGVLFFKENVLHKVIGSYPAEYAIYTYAIPGIQAGCEKSAVVINEVLYYKGRNGVYAYTGGTPVNIGRYFGSRRFEQAVGGTDGAKYYLAMKEEGGGWGLWVYDPATGLWMREDGTQVVDFIEFPDGLEFLSGNKIYAVSGSGEGNFPWSARFAPFYDGTQNRKRHNKLLVRLDLSAGAWAQIEVRRDNGLWTKVWKQTGRRRNSYLVPVLPLRSDSFEVRLSGEGPCIIRGLTWEYATGSEV